MGYIYGLAILYNGQSCSMGHAICGTISIGDGWSRGLCVAFSVFPSLVWVLKAHFPAERAIS